MISVMPNSMPGRCERLSSAGAVSRTGSKASLQPPRRETATASSNTSSGTMTRNWRLSVKIEARSPPYTVYASVALPTRASVSSRGASVTSRTARAMAPISADRKVNMYSSVMTSTTAYVARP